MEAINPNMEENPEKLMRAHVSSVVGAAGGIKSLGERTGIPKGTLEKYLAATSTPSLFNAAKIALAAGVTLDELAGLVLDDPSKYGGGDDKLPASSSSFAFLPFYEDVQAAAGAGAAVISDAAHSVIGFARDLLRESGASPQNCTVIRAVGDSMMPTIPEGAFLVVDHSQREIVANGSIMVIGVNDDLLVKRIRRRFDGSVELISDNTIYAPETLGPSALQKLRVIGRVVYFCRTP